MKLFKMPSTFESMKERHFDILLLDIVMPGFTGMDAAKEVRMSNEQVPIIFMTSSKECLRWKVIELKAKRIIYLNR